MPTPPLPRLIALALAASGALAAQAETADRSKPMTLESDKPCVLSLVRQTSQCSGNVVISQGTLIIRADRLDLREAPDGSRQATALGTPDKPATYRQKRDGVDEHVEGSAQRIEYDGRAGTLRFIGKAEVRRLRGTVPADEILGDTIVWDSTAEQFSVQGGSGTGNNPGGRVRAVLSPREPAASAPPASKASAPGAALRNSTSLGDRR
ncbi:lipopolysaccharide transport periplasmic protein LptA [Ideonella sp. A 288]|uniref:lipopolysaccharide transport periplasmic protein LptA n=1 Tax=Ideonella sp. A 288 TaxID=1962181 RepID=UPI000B4BBB35|nr:lipopolysaccharide transport periplasmic protein LptA [Ideonella sp. A 288]